MPDPVIAHTEAIHITTASGTVLADSNKLEESSSFNLDISNTISERQNLNSDGWTKTGVTFHSGSGSLEYKVVAAGTTADAIEDAALDGSSLYIHVITNPAATTGQTKGHYYEVKIESLGQTWEAGAYKGGTANFRLNGARTAIVVA
jgi:hypothetical protein